MPMQSNDIRNQELDGIRRKLAEAVQSDNPDALPEAMLNMGQYYQDKILREFEAVRDETDTRILAQRGIRQLTGDETKYYQAFISAAKSRNPKQELENLDVVMPKTIIDSVFEDLAEAHPLLSEIDFQNTNGAIEMIMNLDTRQLAKWGPLCDDISKELSSGFKKVSTSLLKLSAYIPVCKAMLDLGPNWLDRYVRVILREALAFGLEYGIVNGTGKDEPIGMTRQVGDGVTVTDGVYPEKSAIAVSDFSPATMGNLVSMLAMGPNGKARTVTRVILAVNPQDYYQKIMPATTIMTPNGTYASNVFPFPTVIVPTAALSRGKAVIGIANRYFAPVGMGREGRILFSDEYHFLEDERVYLIKLYANGMPKDNNAFLTLDISGVQPAAYRVISVTGPDASTDANLASLSLGSAALSPAFAAATTTYTAATTNATNTVNVTPASASASVAVTYNDNPIDNGSAITWADGNSNVVKITVTAADGETSKTYTVTVTKS